ncbi:hypothetical protein [Rugamonas rubra]|uniref:Uncharacterized protein n=1 Tax=Rugamonas rubra TaxID=758825 RepID=A0A1I4M4X1_9BURK|nr:hypothetical protein [Rugamonas rubra]SFL98259.1 hypothetical protein SAMN02982985_02245 [Rugamonas rubra]
MAQTIEQQTPAARSLADLNAVSDAGEDIDDVTAFTKLIKKAEEVAQAAL